MTAKYLVLKQRVLGGTVQAEVGDIVYARTTHDYGLADDDTRTTGIKHISVTKNADGSAPGFTIPRTDVIDPPNDAEIKFVVSYLAMRGLTVYGAHMDLDTGTSEGGCMDYDSAAVLKYLALKDRDPAIPHYPHED